MSQTGEQRLKVDIADALDRRREVLTQTTRVVDVLGGTRLNQQACAMAVPMIYAQWEGFVKEAPQLYLEFLERTNTLQSDTDTSLLAYAWRGSFGKLMSRGSHQHRVELTEKLVASLSEGLRFERSEREVDTKSNLKFEVLEGLADCLCFDIQGFRARKGDLNGLVFRRNDIAHGGRGRTLAKADIVADVSTALGLMEELEASLHAAVDNTSYLRGGAGATT